jgi:hypothetical protein
MSSWFAEFAIQFLNKTQTFYVKRNCTKFLISWVRMDDTDIEDANGFKSYHMTKLLPCVTCYVSWILGFNIDTGVQHLVCGF